MDWGGLNISLPALFISIVTVGLGGPLVIAAWCRVIGAASAINWTDSRGLSYLTVAVLLDLTAIPVLWIITDHLRFAVWLSFLIVSFSFLIASMVSVRGDFGPETRIVKISSIGLFVVNLAGLIVIIVGLPGL